MAGPKSPTNLNTSRNIALEKGVTPASLVQPDLEGFKPMAGDDPGQAAKPSSFGGKDGTRKPVSIGG